MEINFFGDDGDLISKNAIRVRNASYLRSCIDTEMQRNSLKTGSDYRMLFSKNLA